MYVEENFKRYPGQIIPTKINRLEASGVFERGLYYIGYFDNFIVDFDKSFLKETISSDTSIVINALKKVDDNVRIHLFQNNVHALDQLDFYLNKFEQLDEDTFKRKRKYYESKEYDDFVNRMKKDLPLAFFILVL